MQLPEKHFSIYAPVLIFVATVLIYWPGLFAPFYLDDISSIKVNPQLAAPDFVQVCDYYRNRCLGYLSFWLNYQFLPLEPAYYRVPNWILHAGNGVLILLITQQWAAFVYRDAGKTLRLLGLAVALLYVCHPIQVNAVTYTVQRLAVLAAFFFLLCLWSYFKARTAASLTARVAFATLFVTSGVAAINTKENTVMLPAVLFLIEWLLFRVWRERWYVLPPIAMALVAGLLYLLAPDLWVRIDTLTRETPDITRIEYWQAQWVVLWVYVQKIVTFSGYKLEYALSTADFSQVLIITAGLAHFIVLMGAWYFRRALPLITLGIYFFYVTHFVESGLIPIRDIAFEHRNYLPLFGLVLAFFAALHAAVLKWVPRERWRGKQSLVFATIVFFACYATHARNELWADQGAFLQHEARENPDHVRSQHSLAVWYSQQGEYRKALTILWRLFTVSREFNPSVVSSYVGILIQLDDYTKALEVLEMILPQEVGRRPSFGPMYSYLGSIRYQYQQYAEAAAAFEQARLRMVLDENSLVQYILSLIKLNELDRAQQIHALIIELYPDGGGTRGVTTLLQGVLEKSRAGAD